jgi:hypothetical protein
VGVVLLLLLATPATAQDMPVGPDLQLSLLRRILPFDRNFTEHVGEEVVVGIIYQRSFRQSIRAKDALVAAVKTGLVDNIGNIPARFVPIPFEDTSAVERALRDHDIDVVYVPPLRGVDMREIVSLVAENQVMTFTGVPGYLDDGIAVAIGIRAGKPEIIVNLSSSREQGADFSAQFLRLTRVVR